MPTADSDLRQRSGKRAAVRRRLRSLKTQLHQTRRRVRVATGAAVLASVVALGLAVQPEPAPEPVPLGKGKAGVFALADTAQTRTAPAAPAPAASAEAPPANSGDGTPITGGEASYYGDELAGNPTASGEPFRPSALTAAHRSLPLGSRVRVTNVRNGESVIVRVNDRGPFAKNRVIDVSKAAAQEIGLLRRGTGQVRLELLPRSVRG